MLSHSLSLFSGGLGCHDRSFKGAVVSWPGVPCGCREDFGITRLSGGQLPRKRQSDNDRGVCPLLVPPGMWRRGRDGGKGGGRGREGGREGGREEEGLGVRRGRGERGKEGREENLEVCYVSGERRG